jgi:hypothetical protein
MAIRAEVACLGKVPHEWRHGNRTAWVDDKPSIALILTYAWPLLAAISRDRPLHGQID